MNFTKITFIVAISAISLVVIAISLPVSCNSYSPETSHYNSYHGETNHYEPYGYKPYSYGYEVEDNYGNKQWRSENAHNPMEVHGSYGYRDNNGIYREVVYVADKHGFRANVKTNEPGVDGSKSPAAVKVEAYQHNQMPISVHHKRAAVPPVYYSTHV